jgi:hypothetical protein
MMRRVMVLFAVGMLVSACNEQFDDAERGAAARDEYDIRDQTCVAAGDHAVATGVLVNLSESTQEFGVVVRFFDGDVEVGRPQNVNGDEAIEHLSTWDWEAAVPLDDPPDDLRCNVIQVVNGTDVSRDG